MKFSPLTLSLFSSLYSIQKTSASLTFSPSVFVNHANAQITVASPWPSKGCASLAVTDSESWSCGKVNKIAYKNSLYHAPSGFHHILPNYICMFTEDKVADALHLTCVDPTSHKKLYYTLPKDTTNEVMQNLIAETNKLKEKFSYNNNDESLFVGASDNFQINLQFCSHDDKVFFSNMPNTPKVIITKSAGSSSGEAFNPAAWQSLRANDLFQNTYISWTETYDMFASAGMIQNNVEVLTNGVKEGPTHNLYDFHEGVFDESPTSCHDSSYYCVMNKLTESSFKYINFGLSQKTTIAGKSTESVLGSFSVAINGKLEMQPQLNISVFLGYWEKNAYIKADITYPPLDFTMTPGDNSVKTVRFDKDKMQFVTASCPNAETLATTEQAFHESSFDEEEVMN